jgi:hypothetical protein
MHQRFLSHQGSYFNVKSIHVDLLQQRIGLSKKTFFTAEHWVAVVNSNENSRVRYGDRQLVSQPKLAISAFWF